VRIVDGRSVRILDDPILAAACFPGLEQLAGIDGHARLLTVKNHIVIVAPGLMQGPGSFQGDGRPTFEADQRRGEVVHVEGVELPLGTTPVTLAEPPIAEPGEGGAADGDRAEVVQKMQGHIQYVHADVEQSTATGNRTVREPAAQAGDARAAAPERLHVIDLSQPADGGELFRPLHVALETLIHAEHESAPVPPGSGDQVLGGGGVQSERLIEQDMFTGFKRTDGHGLVVGVRHGDIDRIQIVSGEQFIDIGAGLFGTDHGSQFPSPVPVRVGDSCDGAIRMAAEFPGCEHRHLARADHAESNAAHAPKTPLESGIVACWMRADQGMAVSESETSGRKVRMGMIGGGEGAFIGAVHRMAAELDGEIELVCGAFSSEADRSRRSGVSLYRLPAARCYPDYATMFEVEAGLDPSERMDFVTIATPNHLHFPAASAAIDAGFHVVCDKPLTHDMADALTLATLVNASDRLFCLTHNYTGYPMIREARALVASGALGRIRRADCEYLQGWLAGSEETTGNKQAQWRTDPSRSGAAGCFGDIGSHAQNLLEFVTGQNVSRVCADLSTWVEGRALDDDGNVLIRLDGGARGVISASQVAVGEENGLKLRIYGEGGGLTWSQTEPNSLTLKWPDRSVEVRRTGGPSVTGEAASATRLPAGHPEGYLEAFAVLYRKFARAVLAAEAGTAVSPDVPGIADGVRGMRFIDGVVESSARGGIWLDL